MQTASASVSIDVGGIPGVGLVNGRVWHDADFDRVFDANEIALAGWDVELYFNGSLAHAARTAADGVYRMSGVDAELRDDGHATSCASAGPAPGRRTALLGRADSEFTDDLQRITDIIVLSGSNLQNLNLPIDPNGIVYDAICARADPGRHREPRRAGRRRGAAVGCFYDPNQQGQVTLADGYYKFDLNFADPACPSGGAYLLAVTPPSTAYLPACPTIIPPQSSATTAAFSCRRARRRSTMPCRRRRSTAKRTPSELQPPPSVAPRTSRHELSPALDVRRQLRAGHEPDLQQPHSARPRSRRVGRRSRRRRRSCNVARGQLVPYIDHGRRTASA